MHTETDILMTGVGGQGVIMASDILSSVAITAGYDVKKTDSLGMAQRGGSVTSHVRIGDKVFSPLIAVGSADFLLSYERLEAVRSMAMLKRGGVAIVDCAAVPPLSVTVSGYHYPSIDEVRQSLRTIARTVYMLPATEMASELGNPRVSSVLCLGFLSVFLDLPEPQWLDGIQRHLPPRLHEVNLAAFNAGVEAAREGRKEEGE